MGSAQPRVAIGGGGEAGGAVIIPFVQRSSTLACLSWRDRMDVALWQGDAGAVRLVIHERMPADPADLHSYLAVHRRGEAWSRWGVTRCGATVLAWCSVTGRDVGRFSSVTQALGALLGG